MPGKQSFYALNALYHTPFPHPYPLPAPDSLSEKIQVRAQILAQEEEKKNRISYP